MSTALLLREVPCYMLSDLTLADIREETDSDALKELLPRVTLPRTHFTDPRSCRCLICSPPYLQPPTDMRCAACLAQGKNVDVPGDGLFARNIAAQTLPGAVLCDGCFALARENGICAYCGRPLDLDEVLGTYSCPAAEDMRWWDEGLERPREPAQKRECPSEEHTEKRTRV